MTLSVPTLMVRIWFQIIRQLSLLRLLGNWSVEYCTMSFVSTYSGRDRATKKSPISQRLFLKLDYVPNKEEA